MASKNNSNHQVSVILSYLGILCFVPLIVYQKKDDFMKFHIRQGIILFVIEAIIGVLQAVIGSLPAVGIPLGIASLLIFVVIILAIINGLQGKMWKIPVISGYTKLIKI